MKKGKSVLSAKMAKEIRKEFLKEGCSRKIRFNEGDFMICKKGDLCYECKLKLEKLEKGK